MNLIHQTMSKLTFTRKSCSFLSQLIKAQQKIIKFNGETFQDGDSCTIIKLSAINLLKRKNSRAKFATHFHKFPDFHFAEQTIVHKFSPEMENLSTACVQELFVRKQQLN
jgi:hypothetical protein